MFIKRLGKLIIEYNRVIKNRLYGRRSANSYLTKGNKLLSEGELSGAKKVLKQGLNSFPKSIGINTKLANMASNEKDWNKATELWEKVYELQEGSQPIEAFIQLAIAYRKVGRLDAAAGIIREGIQQNKDHSELWNAYAYISISEYDWESAIFRLEKLCNIYKVRGTRAPMYVYIRLLASYQIVGRRQEADQILDFLLKNFKEQLDKDKHGYRKFILFDNGESRIEFYKTLNKTKRVVVTFDAINMVWNNPSFAFKLLMRENVDIIAVRKRRSRTYQQDLSLKDFNDAVYLLAKGYEDRLAYGFSLGAYGTLYYASVLNCRILALSPRLSIHPVYGGKKKIGEFEFKHSHLPRDNSNISPIIVYDPKNKQDNTYINEGLLSVFPNAKLVEIPYGGHGIGPHLSKMGLLKEFLLTFINTEELPVYRKELRKKSFVYYKELSNACFKRNKPNWSLTLIDRSLQLDPLDTFSIRLKIKILSELGQNKEAILFADQSKSIVPHSWRIRLLLINLYLDSGNIEEAKNEAQKAMKKFGNEKSLIRKMEEIQKRSNP